jgi:GDP/UDP-N,N'-diacetylbacillosamine 2-epimerase (hydrolysing)
MKIGVLTSSRADYGIYLPLLTKLKITQGIDLEIIAFGTHMSKFHGYTVNEIKRDDYKVIHEIVSMLTDDDETSVSSSYGLTCLKFADFWGHNRFDWVLCLGDRFEMSAAVQASIPHRLKLAHIHGGETTLGAIDNIYRHQITLASELHFTATEEFSRRVEEILGKKDNVYTVGSLSIEEIDKLKLPTEDEFRDTYNLPKTFILVTFHPETFSPYKNEKYGDEMYKALSKICQKQYVVITMPNADTCGTIFRERLNRLKEQNQSKILLIENFGKLNYFAAMKYCSLLIGNTSSGIIEAASFGKYVINVGNRQLGRAQSSNVINCDFAAESIINALETLGDYEGFSGENIYKMDSTSIRIINYLKTYEKF